MTKNDAIINWIKENCGPNVTDGLTPNTNLLEGGILDSLQIVNLISFLEEEFSVAIDMEEVVPENFESIQHIIELVDRSPDEASA